MRLVLILGLLGVLSGCVMGPSFAIRDAGGDFARGMHTPGTMDFKYGPRILTDDRFEAIATDLRNDKRWIELSLDGNNVTDRIVPLLTTMPQMRRLRISQTKITFAGIQKLSAVPQLVMLGVSPVQVTPPQLAELAKLRPHLEVIRYFDEKPPLADLQAVLNNPAEKEGEKQSARRLIEEHYYVE